MYMYDHCCKIEFLGQHWNIQEHVFCIINELLIFSMLLLKGTSNCLLFIVNSFQRDNVVKCFRTGKVCISTLKIVFILEILSSIYYNLGGRHSKKRERADCIANVPVRGAFPHSFRA